MINLKITCWFLCVCCCDRDGANGAEEQAEEERYMLYESMYEWATHAKKGLNLCIIFYFLFRISIVYICTLYIYGSRQCKAV